MHSHHARCVNCHHHLHLHNHSGQCQVFTCYCSGSSYPRARHFTPPFKRSPSQDSHKVCKGVGQCYSPISSLDLYSPARPRPSRTPLRRFPFRYPHLFSFGRKDGLVECEYCRRAGRNHLNRVLREGRCPYSDPVAESSRDAKARHPLYSSSSQSSVPFANWHHAYPRDDAETSESSRALHSPPDSEIQALAGSASELRRIKEDHIRGGISSHTPDGSPHEFDPNQFTTSTLQQARDSLSQAYWFLDDLIRGDASGGAVSQSCRECHGQASADGAGEEEQSYSIGAEAASGYSGGV